jgi:Cu(I)/Ag(I) efflux system membrane fusion protein
LVVAAVVAGLAGGVFLSADERVHALLSSRGLAPVPTTPEDSGEPKAPTAGGAPVQGSGKRILYYRNPMGLPDTSKVPKKDWMGMDYIPVYEGEEQDNGSTVKVSLDRVQRIGVVSEPVERRHLKRTVRAVGTVQVDERRIGVITTRFEGWIEKLHIAATGDAVKRGQSLLRLYSPDLAVAAEDYVAARRGLTELPEAAPARGAFQGLASGALQRLRALGVPGGEIARLEAGGAVRRTLDLPSPFPGVVIEKSAVEGMRVMPGETLYRIADLSTAWVIAEIFETDLPAVREGQMARVRSVALAGRQFDGRITYIYPTLGRETRTARLRIEIPNPDLALRPDMYADVDIEADVGGGGLTVPTSAVVDSGVRTVVLVDRGEGRFEPRDVKLGQRADGFAEVLEGLSEGERIVISANFLIDAESNLKAALRGFAPTNGDQKQ